jgi:hypothetical protein
MRSWVTLIIFGLIWSLPCSNENPYDNKNHPRRIHEFIYVKQQGWEDVRAWLRRLKISETEISACAILVTYPGVQKDGITGEFRRNAPECGGFADALSESLKQNRLSELKFRWSASHKLHNPKSHLSDPLKDALSECLNWFPYTCCLNDAAKRPA